MKNRFHQKGKVILIGEIHPVDSLLDAMRETKGESHDKTESLVMQEITDEMDLIAMYNPHYILLERTEVEMNLRDFRTRALVELAEVIGAELIPMEDPYTSTYASTYAGSVVRDVYEDLLKLHDFVSLQKEIYENYRRLLANSKYENEWDDIIRRAMETYKSIEACAKKLNFMHSLSDRNWLEVLQQERDYFKIEVREEKWARLISKLYRSTPEATIVAIIGRAHIEPNSKLVKYLRISDVPLKLHDVGKIYEGKL